MAFKDWLGGGRKEDSYSVDDLITLERYEEAERRLRLELKEDMRDLRKRIKLADLLMRKRRVSDAVDEYIVVADGYARDGFYDKATALLNKIARVAPADDKIQLKLEAIRRLKRFERRREVVLDGLMEARRQGAASGSGSAAFQVQQLWRELTDSPIIDHLGEDQLKRLFSQFRLVHFEEGEEVVRRGGKREQILLVAHGEISARTRLTSERVTTVRAFAPGDLIGDRALLEHQPWPADYVASQESAALMLDREALERALTGEADPKRLLDALREQRHDHDVAASMRTMADKADRAAQAEAEASDTEAGEGDA